jgi:hypothetical protein
MDGRIEESQPAENPIGKFDLKPTSCDVMSEEKKRGLGAGGFILYLREMVCARLRILKFTAAWCFYFIPAVVAFSLLLCSFCQ